APPCLCCTIARCDRRCSLRQPPPATLFPYTTLFRSLGFDPRFPEPFYPDAAYEAVEKRLTRLLDQKKLDVIIIGQCDPAIFPERSEEHTSELQSRENLVCRLLLEKKKKKQAPQRSRR